MLLSLLFEYSNVYFQIMLVEKSLSNTSTPRIQQRTFQGGTIIEPGVQDLDTLCDNCFPNSICFVVGPTIMITRGGISGGGGIDSAESLVLAIKSYLAADCGRLSKLFYPFNILFPGIHYCSEAFLRLLNIINSFERCYCNCCMLSLSNYKLAEDKCCNNLPNKRLGLSLIWRLLNFFL